MTSRLTGLSPTRITLTTFRVRGLIRDTVELSAFDTQTAPGEAATQPDRKPGVGTARIRYVRGFIR